MKKTLPVTAERRFSHDLQLNLQSPLGYHEWVNTEQVVGSDGGALILCLGHLPWSGVIESKLYVICGPVVGYERPADPRTALDRPTFSLDWQHQRAGTFPDKGATSRGHGRPRRLLHPTPSRKRQIRTQPVDLQRWRRPLLSAPRYAPWNSRAARMFGPRWVLSLLVLAPVATICIAVVVAVTVATMIALAILTRLIPQQLTTAGRRHIASPVSG